MGCDIHTMVERKNGLLWEELKCGKLFDDVDNYYHDDEQTTPFDYRSYGMFAFLCKEVRNYSEVPGFEERGVPDNASPEFMEFIGAYSCDAHTPSWLGAAELLSFDYNQTFENMRCSRTTVLPNGVLFTDGAARADEGKKITFKEFLPPQFFRDLERLKSLGNPETLRVVFYFDN